MKLMITHLSRWLTVALLVFVASCRQQKLILPESENSESNNNGAIHLTLGNPSGATANTSNSNNYLLTKRQYVAAYNRSRGCANWVAWYLSDSWLGSVDRQNDFRPDNSLPSDWSPVTPSDYEDSGFDRGHYCPSGDRTNTVTNNSATFLMTNLMPQSPDNNQGPWEQLESYCRSLVNAGNELYIYAGSYGRGGEGRNGRVNTLAEGKITIPSHTYKIIVVLPKDSNDLSRINADTRVIAVRMPNVQGIKNSAWRQYRVSVYALEATTGYDFLSNVSVSVQSQLESRVDNR